MNRFIESNGEDDFYFAFVDSLTEQYDEASERPIEWPSSSSSPFKGKTTHECHLLLKQLVEDTGSDIDVEIFAIMDETSTDNGTLLLAEGPAEENGEAESVRARFEDASLVCLNFRAAKLDVAELRERAEAEADGVLRFGKRARGR